MRKLLVAALALAALAAPQAAAAAPRVLAVHFDLEVNPATQSYLSRQIERAAHDHYDAVAILLDTPGGLSESMRKIVQSELASTIPVIVYVTPPGARAASAGVWIGQAADILAMAPETNIGSSTPISSGGGDLQKDLRRKVVNDAAASLRSLAKSHGRNVAWADRAVRQASNLTADEALARNVIDLTAPTLPALLDRIDGRKTVPKAFVLQTRDAAITDVRPGFMTRLLSTLIDPNIVTLLFLAGIAGVGFEVLHPGIVLPGALGGIALLTSLFGFAVLPISWAGLGLILLGIALLTIDLYVPTHGALTLTGLIALGVGLVMLFHTAPSPYSASVPLMVALTASLGAFWVFALAKALQARRMPAATGASAIVGQLGEVRPDGRVFVDGELWRAASDDGEPLVPGEEVEIDRVGEGLVLGVRRRT